MKTFKYIMTFLLVSGISTLFAGVIGFYIARCFSEGNYIQWKFLAKSPVANGKILSATIDSLFIQADTGSIYQLDRRSSTSKQWEKSSIDEPVPSDEYGTCWFQYKEHPFLQPVKQEVKTSYCLSGAYVRTDYVLTRDDEIWYWTKEVSDFEPLFWYFAAIISLPLGFAFGGLLFVIGDIFWKKKGQKSNRLS